mgnify:CR=1 FL=1
MKDLLYLLNGRFDAKNSAALRRLCSNRGMSLLEVLIASVIALIVFSSILATLMGITALTVMSQQYAQVSHVLRGHAEELKGTGFNLIVNSNNPAVSYDAGPDNLYGTLDDLKGTLTVQVRDAIDMDGDNNTAEATIDVDGDGVNDCLDFPACTDPYAKPVRITFTWSQKLWGLTKNMSMSLDTLIAQ